MRHRTIGLAAAVLLAAPIVASCTRPPGGGGGTTTTMPGGGGGELPAPQGENCGTITITGNTATAVTASGSPQAPTAATGCFLKYHGTTATEYLKTIEQTGGTTVTIAYQAMAGHSLTLTKQITNSATSEVVSTTSKHCTGFGAQLLFKSNGRPNTDPGSITNCTI